MEDQKNGFSRFSFERSGYAKTLSGNVKLVRKLSRICVEAKKKADRWMKSKWKQEPKQAVLSIQTSIPTYKSIPLKGIE